MLRTAITTLPPKSARNCCSALNPLWTSPIDALREYRLFWLDLGSAAVDKELDSVDEAGIA